MANMLQGEAAFIASGRTWHIVLDFYAFAVAAKALDVGVDELLRKISPDIDESGRVARAPHQLDIGYLLHASLLRRHPDISLPDAVNLLSEGAPVLDALGTALTGALPPAESEKAASENGSGNGDGTGAKPS